MSSMTPTSDPSPARRRPVPWKGLLLRIAGGLLVYLALESILSPEIQPSARLSVGLIHLYQKVGSPAVSAMGGHCRYEPSCSHYAEDAISHFGTLWGGLKTAGRLWRCSPWGGSGYDPAF